MNTTAIKSAFSSRWSLFWRGWKVRGDVLGLCAENERMVDSRSLANAVEQIKQLRVALAEKDAQISVLQEAHRAEMEAHALAKKGNATLLRFVHQSHHLDLPIEQGTARGVLATAVGLVLVLFTLTANAQFPPPFIHNWFDTNLSPAVTLTGDVTGSGYITIPALATNMVKLNGTNAFTGTNKFSKFTAFGQTAATVMVDITSGNSQSALHVSGVAGSLKGLYVENPGVNDVYLGNSLYNGTWIAQDTYAEEFGFDSAGFSVYANSGTVAGGVFTPTIRLLLNTSGNMGIGTTGIGNRLVVNGNIEITNGAIKFSGITASNPPTSGAGTAWIFPATNNVGTAEIFTMDGAGVIKQISEHAMDGPTNIYDLSDPFPNVCKEWNPYLGYVRWINRSREAVVAQAVIELAANSYDAWLGIQAGTNTALLANNNVWATNRVNWANSAMGTAWYLQMRQFVLASKANRNVSTIESFSDYNTRLGLNPGDPGYLQTRTWTQDQQAIQAAYATTFTNSVANYNSAVAGGSTNAVAPVWSPPAVQPVPAWLQSRGVN